MTREVQRLKKPGNWATEGKSWDMLGNRGDRGHLYVPLPTKVQRTSQKKKKRAERKNQRMVRSAVKFCLPDLTWQDGKVASTRASHIVVLHT